MYLFYSQVFASQLFVTFLLLSKAAWRGVVFIPAQREGGKMELFKWQHWYILLWEGWRSVEDYSSEWPDGKHVIFDE